MRPVSRDPQVPFAAYIGLDWSDQKHAVCLCRDESCEPERLLLENTPTALHDWAAQLCRRFGGRPVAVALEQSRGAVVHALMAYEFLVLYPINPLSLAKYRKAFSTGGAKDDPPDAELLSEMVCKHRDRLRPWKPDSPLTRSLALLTEKRRKMVNMRTALTHQLRSELKGSFPQALRWAGPLDSPRAAAFLRRWPSLQKLQRSKPEALRRALRKQGCRRPGIERIERELPQAVPLTQDEAVLRVCALSIPILTDAVRRWGAAIERLDDEIAKLFARHPDRAIYESLPGAGPVLAPRLLAAMGTDRKRFETAQQVQQFSGVAPVLIRSGNSCWVRWRLGCPKFVRQSFHEFAGCSIPHCRWAKLYYEQQRSKGSKHHAAVRALAYKWIRIIFHLWKTGQQYDDQIYMQALRKRNSPLAQGLEERCAA